MGFRSRGVVAGLVATAAFAADLVPVANFTQSPSALQIVSPCVPRMPWTVAGEYGALLGRQGGKFEAWLWPVKVLSNFRISAKLADYPVPIDVNALAAEIRVTPAETVITYSHAAFTIRQHMFATRGRENPASAAAVFFEIESARSLAITFSFTPEMLRMWPAPNFGRPNGEWVSRGGEGAYILHTDNPSFSGIVAMPRTHPGILVPYQEHPQTYPLQLMLDFDPKRDRGLVFPLIMGMADGQNAVEQAANMESALPDLYASTQTYYAHFFDQHLSVESPDTRLNEAAGWAEIAIDQMQVRYHGETGMVAGYYESADSARPGYAWFFGRDTLWTTYAMNSYGDFDLTRKAIEFLIHRQRADGKIMHEFSQTAGEVNWSATPYLCASADSTPLFVMAMWDYVRTSNDTAFLKDNWDALRKAYGFMLAHDSDHDGIYDNSEGTGWVESWPTGMPHQEIYLAALDQQAAEDMSHLSAMMGDQETSARAHTDATNIRTAIESEYYDPQRKFYAFSRNPDGSRDQTATIFPSVAWWDGTLALANAEPMLTRWASDEFSADWGTRDISALTSFYDPISYHQGSMWPLFTGWVSLAEYRAGRSLSAYAHLMQNVNLTWAQDLGSVTELLSGDFYQPLGRSSSHQMWSSAMVVTDLIRGLFGLDYDAPDQTITVAPQIPASWDGAQLHHVRLGSLLMDLKYQRSGDQMQVTASTEEAAHFCLAATRASAQPCKAAAARVHTLTLPVKPVEIEIQSHLPAQGSVTSNLKVLDEHYSAREAVFTLAAPGGSTLDLLVRINRPNISVHNAELVGNRLHVEFPKGSGYLSKILTFTW